MKKLIALVVLLCGFMPVLWAADGCDQHLSREDFRNKQKAFIIEQAGLTKEEAAKFFPVYFELQEKKKKLNDESWSLMRQGKDDKTTEAQYEEIVARYVTTVSLPTVLISLIWTGLKRYFPTRRYSLFNARRCVSIGKC